MNYQKHIICMLLAFVLTVLTVGFAGCNKDNETKEPATETKLTGIVFAANDSFPGLKKATFTVDFSHDTALVYNEDSLPVGTHIDSVVATFYFTTTIGYAKFVSDTDTVLITSADTLNFTPRPCHLYVVSEDGKHSRNYDIYVNVHTVDPDLYVWEQTKERLFSGNCDVYAESLSGTVYLYTQDGITARLYRTQDGKKWWGPVSLLGLPKGANIRQIRGTDSYFYYAGNDRLYRSVDGATWLSEDYSGEDFTLVSMLFEYNDSVWALVRDKADESLWFATMKEGGRLAKQQQIGAIEDHFHLADEAFPVSDFATVTFLGKTGRKRAMIVGGFDEDGTALNSRWNLEWIDTDSGEGYYRLENFSVEQPSFPALSGAAIIRYDEKMLLFGALESGSELLEEPVLESYDEGMYWFIPDSAQNVLPENYKARQRLAVVETYDQAILLIGGQNRTTTFGDVWRGKKNSIDWD